MANSSLIDALLFEPFTFQKTLLDSFLMEPDSYEVWVIKGQSFGGAGTASNPYVVDTAPHFDTLMSGFQPRTTVHLGAGTFETAGQWIVKAGQKIRGAGMGVTTISRVGLTANNLNYAIDAGTGSFVSGVEVSDLTLDCGMGTQTGLAACGVRLYGANVRLSRLRVTNFGNKYFSTDCAVVAIGGASSAWDPSNCVVDGCRFSGTDPVGSSQPLTCIQLTCLTDGFFHRDCVVRNCYIDGGWDDAANHLTRGLSAGGGVGTVVEGNHILNVREGIFWDSSVYQTKDLVVRDNQFGDDSGVNNALRLGTSGTAAKAVLRILFQDNCIRLKDGTSAIDDGTPKGVYLDSSTGTPFGLVILRGNVFEQSALASNQLVMAGDLRKATNVIVEANVLNLGATHPLIHSGCTNVKFFNNRKPDGTLVQGYNSTNATSGTKDDELESEVEDNLMIALT